MRGERGEGRTRLLLLHGPALRRGPRVRHTTGHTRTGALDAAGELPTSFFHASRDARDAPGRDALGHCFPCTSHPTDGGAGCRYTYTGSMDPAGAVPIAVVNWFAERRPAALMNAIRDVAVERHGS